MFDTVLVAKNLIDEALKDTDIILESSDGYYDFQTKDLDNILSCFYIEENGSFLLKKQEFKWIEPDLNKKGKWNFGHMEPYGDPEMIEDTRTCYIDFYDFYNSEEERIFITFKAHVKCGKLQEPISILSIERVNLKEESIKHKEIEEKWEKIRKDKRWIIGCAIRDFRYKISRFFYPLIRSIDKFQEDLLRKAREQEFPKPKEYKDSYYD